jgi:hypothetical protein
MPTRKLYDSHRLFAEDVSADNTVAIADSGVVLNQTADAKTTTLPAVASTNVGLEVIVRLGGVKAGGPVGSGSNGSQGHTISPNASDKIMGLGVAGTDDKDLLMAKDDMIAGDYVRLRSDGVNGWFVVEAVGAWTFQA